MALPLPAPDSVSNVLGDTNWIDYSHVTPSTGFPMALPPAAPDPASSIFGDINWNSSPNFPLTGFAESPLGTQVPDPAARHINNGEAIFDLSRPEMPNFAPQPENASIQTSSMFFKSLLSCSSLAYFHLRMEWKPLIGTMQDSASPVSMELTTFHYLTPISQTTLDQHWTLNSYWRKTVSTKVSTLMHLQARGRISRYFPCSFPSFHCQF